ncbi:MAG: hypothetical protein NTU51_00545 [Bacteroidetes bacterium]|nr:hypothetical protein [Bacteroidota bacterium]
MARRVNTILFLLMLFATLITPWDSRKWLEFSDTGDYLSQSKIPLNTREFWAPHHSGTFYPRPFTVPLMYKLAGSEPERIVIMQKYIHCISAFFLVFSLLLLITTEVFSGFIMICIYMLMSWWTISGWTNQILSESISISFLFLWIASFILAWKRNKWYYWIFHLVIMVLFSFTRDSWPYILVSFYLLVAFTAWFYERPLLIPALLMIPAAFILFFIQQNTAKTGDRYRLPMINTIAVRIISNAEYTAWFKKEGMPCTDSLLRKYSRIDVTVDADRHKIWDLYYNRNYESLWTWIHDKGKTVYMEFMITHPSYTLLLKESKQQKGRILSYDLWYSGEVAGYSKSVQKFFPLFNPWWLLICNLMLIVRFFRMRKLILIFPVILSLVFLMNVFISYNADALEVERHLFITMVMIQFIVFISLAILGDSLFNKTTNNHNI